MTARTEALYEYGGKPILFWREGVDSLIVRSAINFGAKLQFELYLTEEVPGPPLHLPSNDGWKSLWKSGEMMLSPLDMVDAIAGHAGENE